MRRQRAVASEIREDGAEERYRLLELSEEVESNKWTILYSMLLRDGELTARNVEMLMRVLRIDLAKVDNRRRFTCIQDDVERVEETERVEDVERVIERAEEVIEEHYVGQRVASRLIV